MAIVLLLTSRPDAAIAQEGEQYVNGADLPPPWADTLEIFETDFQLPQGVTLPDSVDLSLWFPPAGNQYRQYACTAWATAYGIMSYRDNLRQGYKPDKKKPVDPSRAYSPAFVFNLVKQFTDTTSNCRGGIDFHKAIQLCQGVGCCSLAQLPYDTTVTACESLVPVDLLDTAAQHTLPVPIKLSSSDVTQWRYHLARKQPILVQVTIDTSFVKGGKRAAKNGGWFIWRHRNYRCMKGGHMIVCTGYNDRDSTFTILNSFGTGWGTQGYCKMTRRLIEYHCGAAYVFANEDPLVADTVDGRQADRTTYTGDSLQEKMRPGEYQLFNDLKMRLVKEGRGGAKALVEFSDTKTGTVIRDMEFTSGQTLGFCHNGEAIQFTYHERPWLFALFDGSLPFVVKEHAVERDPYVLHEKAHLEKLREGSK